MDRIVRAEFGDALGDFLGLLSASRPVSRDADADRLLRNRSFMEVGVAGERIDSVFIRLIVSLEPMFRTEAKPKVVKDPIQHARSEEHGEFARKGCFGRGQFSVLLSRGPEIGTRRWKM